MGQIALGHTCLPNKEKQQELWAEITWPTLKPIPKEDIVYYDGDSGLSGSEKPGMQELEDYIDSKKKFLVLHQDLFVGCEAPHIIYVVSGFELSSTRCSFLRAIEQLNIVNVVSYYTFRNTKEINLRTEEEEEL